MNTVYVSNSGDDITGNGTQSLPYATLGKVSSVLLNSTIVYLAKGSTFINDKLILSDKNNITIDAYGTGDDPVLTGLKSVTGWSDEGDDIWSKQDDDLPTEVTNLFISGVRALLGRTVAKTATDGSTSTLVDSALSDADGYWDNAELVISYYDWSRGISRVSDYTSKTFTFPIYYQDEESGQTYAVSAGKTYWIQNHLNCLDAQDEWAYNNSSKTLYIYSTVEPSDITVTYGEDCIEVDNSKYITIQNININGSQQCGINIDSSSYITIDNIDFTYSGIYSILGTECKDITISNCTGDEQNNDFVNVSKSTNVIIEGNTVSKCGMVAEQNRYMSVPFRGGTGGITAMLCNNVIVRNNIVGYTAYNGISMYYGQKFLIEGNYVHHFNYNKYDGGGIYIITGSRWFIPTREVVPVTSGCVVRNIVTDGNSTENSSGIYLDSYTQEFEIAYNFCAGNKYNLHLHDNATLNIHHNTLVSENGQSGNIYHSMTLETSIRSLIENNTLVNKTTSCPSVYVNVAAVREQTYKDNDYCYPLGKVGTGTDDSMFKIAATWMDLVEWVADEGRVVWTRTGEAELTPSTRTDTVPINYFVEYFINPTEEATTIEEADLLYDDYIDLAGVPAAYPIALPAKGSYILLRDPDDAPTEDVDFVLTTTGSGAGVSTLRLIVTEEITLTLDGTARFYDDLGGTVNEGTERVIPVISTLYTVYLKCPSATANLNFSDITQIIRYMQYGTTNCASFAGDISQIINCNYFFSTGNNIYSGSVAEMTDLTVLLVYGSNTLTGDLKNLSLLSTLDVRGSSSLTLSTAIRMLCLANIVFYTTTTFTSANINQILADLWVNRDEYRTASAARIINIMGNVASGAPTGQGIIDKAALQAYRTPGNDSNKSLWTIYTR